MSPNTIKKGLAELTQREEMPDFPVSSRLRVEGGGRKRCSETDPELVEALEQLVDPVTRGDPESPLRWTCKSTTHLAAVLTKQGHSVSPRTVGRLLNADGYSLQSNRKTKEGADHPDRNAQFEHINTTVKQFPTARSAGDLGGYEEEGTGRAVQKWGARVATAGRARRGTGA